MTTYESILEKQANKVIDEIHYGVSQIKSSIKINFFDTNLKIDALVPNGPVSRYSIKEPTNTPIGPGE